MNVINTWRHPNRCNQQHLIHHFFLLHSIHRCHGCASGIYGNVLCRSEYLFRVSYVAHIFIYCDWNYRISPAYEYKNCQVGESAIRRSRYHHINIFQCEAKRSRTKIIYRHNVKFKAIDIDINYMLGRHAKRSDILILYCVIKRNSYHASDLSDHSIHPWGFPFVNTLRNASLGVIKYLFASKLPPMSPRRSQASK